MKEEWRYIDGADMRYMVSSLGRVKSVDRHVEHAKHGSLVFYAGRVLKTDRKRSKGYQVCVISLGPKQTTKTVHRLVAEAFIPNPDNLPLVRHLDENKDNNKVSNLAWGTMQDNYRDMVCWSCGAPYHKRKSRND